MPQIYVHNKPLFLVDKVTTDVEAYLQQPDSFFIQEISPSSLKNALQKLEEENIRAGIIQHTSVNELVDAFKSLLTPVVASGGFVYTKKEDVLLIFRKGKWDLPKGKLDEDEELKACALREVEEETGVSNLRIVQPLCVTYHTYYEGQKHILKESHWFLMEAKKAVTLIPQTEEDIEKCEWVQLQNLSAYKTNMHASIIDVVEEAENILVKKSS